MALNEEWMKEIENTVNSKFTPTPAPVKPASKVKPAMKVKAKDGFGFYIVLFLLASLVGVVLLGDISFKNEIKSIPDVVVAPTPEKPIFVENNDIKNKVDGQFNLIQAIQAQTQINKERTILLGSVFNHNMWVLQTNLPKTELIYINQDWTINRMPDRLDMEDKDRAFFEKYIKRAE